MWRTNRGTGKRFMVEIDSSTPQGYDEWSKHVMMCRYFQNMDSKHMYDTHTTVDDCWCHKVPEVYDLPREASGNESSDDDDLHHGWCDDCEECEERGCTGHEDEEDDWMSRREVSGDTSTNPVGGTEHISAGFNLHKPMFRAEGTTGGPLISRGKRITEDKKIVDE